MLKSSQYIMKLPFLLIGICLFVTITSCEQAKPKSELQKKMELDSFTRAKYGESADEYVKKMVNETIAKAMFDTVGLSKAPVKILSAKIIKQEYSSFRNVYLRYRNVSGKTIQAIKFTWYGRTLLMNQPILVIQWLQALVQDLLMMY